MTDHEFLSWNLYDVRYQLVTLFITAIIIQNSVEALVPVILDLVSGEAATIDNDDTEAVTVQRTVVVDGKFTDDTTPVEIQCPVVSQVEKEITLDEYDSTRDDMSEIMVHFGYVTLFAYAFPAVPALALLNALVEVKVDLYKLLKNTQRPHMHGANGLGRWNLIMSVGTYACILTNLWMFASYPPAWFEFQFMSDGDIGWSIEEVIIVLFLILLMMIIAVQVIIPDVPDNVNKHYVRQNLVMDTLVQEALIDESSESSSEGPVIEVNEIYIDEHTWSWRELVEHDEEALTSIPGMMDGDDLRRTYSKTAENDVLSFENAKRDQPKTFTMDKENRVSRFSEASTLYDKVRDVAKLRAAKEAGTANLNINDTPDITSTNTPGTDVELSEPLVEPKDA